MTSGSPPPPARRTPRAQVRRRLLTSAAEVFAEQGYAEATVDEIALRAGFTKGAIYSNFGNKQALFAAVLQTRAEDERERLLTEASDEPNEIARSVARIMAEEITTDTQRGRLGLEFAAHAARDDAVRESWTPLRRAQREVAARVIVQVTDRSGLELTAEPAVAALIMHCLTNGLWMEHLADPGIVDADAIERALSTVITALTSARLPTEESH